MKLMKKGKKVLTINIKKCSNSPLERGAGVCKSQTQNHHKKTTSLRGAKRRGNL
jgi:hypothetical protein